MGDSVTTDFFKGNRERLRTLFTGTAPIVIGANGLLQRNSDVTFPFRQDSTFWYLTGIEEPDVVLVMDRGKEYLITPMRDDHRAAFDGAIDQNQLTKVSGIETVLDEKTGWRQLGVRLKKVKHVATLAAAPAYVKDHGLYTNPARAHLIDRIKAQNAEVELLDLRPHITRMRAIKQPEELQQIQRAIDITSDTLKRLHKKGWQQFAYEYEAEAAITAAFRKANAEHAYHPIVAAGANACTLHYVKNGDAITGGSLLLLDVGAEVGNYAADITRTYVVGEPTKRQQQVFDAVLAVQEFALERLKPGILLHDYELAIQQFMGEKLRELALIKSIEPETVRKYYPHATSHHLGLDVHDIADYDRPLEAGMVLTVEPGIYIPEEGIGIRIEDNIIIEADGPRVMSNGLPSVLS
jgi:Xaa-Pro aminopeptidase